MITKTVSNVHYRIHGADLEHVKRYPALVGLPFKKRFHYIRFCLSAACGKRFAHRHFPDHITVGYKELESSFGRGGFKRINGAIGWLELTDSWSKDQNYTRGLRLSDEGRTAIDTMLGSRDNLSKPLVDERQRSIMSTKANGLFFKDARGFDVKSKAVLPSSCPVDVNGIHEAAELLQRWRDHYRDGTLKPDDYGPFGKLAELGTKADRIQWLELRLNWLLYLYRQAHSASFSFGCVETVYFESRSGRFYAAHDLHLQNAPREVRKIALKGCWDYDIANCHYAILQQLAQRYGVQTPAINDYIARKADIRREMSESLYIPLEVLKSCLISLVYGARASVRAVDAIPLLLTKHGGPYSAKRLYKHPTFAGLMEDVRRAGKAVVDGADRHRGAVVNAMGKSISRDAGQPEILAHLLQGIEAKMLNIVLELYPEEVILLCMHDGWAADRPLDVAKMEAEIKAQTGFVVSIEAALI